MDSASKLIDYDKYLFNKVNKSLTKRAKSILQDVFNKYDSKGKTFLNFNDFRNILNVTNPGVQLELSQFEVMFPSS